MKYSAQLYATALAELLPAQTGGVAQPHKAEADKALIQNFLHTVEKNGDTRQLPKIVDETERLLRAKTGQRKVVVESARPLETKLQTNLERLFPKQDVVETKIRPELVAGVKVTVDEEKQYDGSLKRKLDKLFIYH